MDPLSVVANIQASLLAKHLMEIIQLGGMVAASLSPSGYRMCTPRLDQQLVMPCRPVTLLQMPGLLPELVQPSLPALLPVASQWMERQSAQIM
jgi:hypothetical protein